MVSPLSSPTYCTVHGIGKSAQEPTRLVVQRRDLRLIVQRQDLHLVVQRRDLGVVLPRCVDLPIIQVHSCIRATEIILNRG